MDEELRELEQTGQRAVSAVSKSMNYIEETLSVKFVSENETEIEKFSWADLEDLNRDMSKRKSAPDAGFKDYPDMNGAYDEGDNE